MSFRSDAAALSALCSAIFKRGYSIAVWSAGDKLCEPTRSFLSVSVAVHAVTDDCMLLIIDKFGKRCGWFRLLLQDDPDCLIVDYGVNTLTEAISAEWSEIGGHYAS